MPDIKEIWGEDIARHLSNINAKRAEYQKAEESRKQYEVHKAEIYNNIEKNIKAIYSPFFQK